jgi:hypothetical protein
MADIQSLISKAKPQAPSKFIVMGDPMTGKTTIAAKAPSPLFISTDGNAAKAGLHAIQADSLNVVREAIDFFETAKEYETLVIDTVEGIADLFERTTIDNYNQQNGSTVTSLTEVPYGILSGKFNRSLAAFAETLWGLQKNVVVLTYTKRQVDEVSGSIILNSELKSIRQFTRFADGLILTSFDGDKYRAGVVSKRTVMAGEVDYGSIEPFLRAAGWELPVKKTKIGNTKR